MFAFELFFNAFDIWWTHNLKTIEGVWGLLPPFIICTLNRLYNGGPPRGLGDLGRMAFYFQGSREHW